MDHLLIYNGKVRDIYSLGDNYLLLKATDRVSSFDRHIGIIPGKGELLNKMSKYWFSKTKHIIPNHLLSTEKNVALVKRCKPIMLEILLEDTLPVLLLQAYGHIIKMVKETIVV